MNDEINKLWGGKDIDREALLDMIALEGYLIGRYFDSRGLTKSNIDSNLKKIEQAWIVRDIKIIKEVMTGNTPDSNTAPILLRNANIQVRNYEAIKNFCINISDGGVYWNEFLLGAREMISPKKDFPKVLPLLLSAFKEIEVALESFSKKRKELEDDFTEMSDLYNKTGNNKEFRYEIISDLELSSLAHFVLCIYANTFPRDVIKKTPKQLVAISLIMILLNTKKEGSMFFPYDKSDALSFGGWLSRNSYLADSLYYALEEEFAEYADLLQPISKSENIPTFIAPEGDMKDFEIEDFDGFYPKFIDIKELETRILMVAIRLDAPMLTPEKIRSLVKDSEIKFSHSKYIDLIMNLISKENMRGEQLFKELLDIATDAWNVYPHDFLNGKSPQEMIVINSNK